MCELQHCIDRTTLVSPLPSPFPACMPNQPRREQIETPAVGAGVDEAALAQHAVAAPVDRTVDAVVGGQLEATKARTRELRRRRTERLSETRQEEVEEACART